MSIRPSVSLTHEGIVLTRLYQSSNNQHRAVAWVF